MSRRPTPASAGSKDGLSWLAAVFAAAWVIASLLQFASGAYKSEFIGYPDEPAHLVTSLMAHDYARDLFRSSPVAFAKSYYVHYPEVAIGHWPPILYMITAAWTVFFSPARISLFLLMAALDACISAALYVASRPYFSRAGRVAIALSFPLLLVVQQFAGMVMAEIPLTLFCFASALAYARFLATERWQDSALFGVFASLAILTKGSGWLLVLLPVLSVAFTLNPGALIRRTFWIGPAIIALTCLPWQILTLQLAKEGWNGPEPGLTSTVTAIAQLSMLLVRNTTGFGVFLFVLVGAVTVLIVPLKSRTVDPFWAVMGSLTISTIVFHALVPAGLEARKTIIAAPPVLLFAAAGIAAIARELAEQRWLRRTAPQLLTLACVAVFAVQAFEIPRKNYVGYGDLARSIASDPALNRRVILLSTQSHEGPFVAELAMAEQRPGHIILRASKVLAKTDWNGQGYQGLYRTPEAMKQYLREIPVDLLVLETSPGHWNFEHHRILMQMLRTFPKEFRLVKTIPRLHNNAEEGQIYLYQRSSTDLTGSPQIDISRITREVLSR